MSNISYYTPEGLKKLRDEKKFKSLDELKEQIKLDVIKAKLFFDKKNL